MRRLIPLLLTLCFSCKDSFEPMGPRTIPYPVFLLIKEKNSRLPDNLLNQLRLFYLKENKRNYIYDFTRGTDGYDTLGIMSTVDIGFVSADQGIKDFYIDYPSGDVDTLFADFQNIPSKDASGNYCYCTTPLIELKFNGKIAIPDTSRKEQMVYLLEKP